MRIDYFDQIWQSKGPGKRSYKEGSAETWDGRVEEFTNDRPDERVSKIVALLVSKNMLDKDSTILDIGCGPGRFAAEFAMKSKKVVGVDISSKMLAKAKEYSAAQNITNTEFIEMDWNQVDLAALQWKHHFTLVAAIMSPAISNRESMEKIIEASSENGFLCHFVDHHDPINDELKDKVLGMKSKDIYGNKDLYCCLNYLWIKQRYPEVSYIDTWRENRRTSEEAIRHYINRLEMKTDLTDGQRDEIKKIIRSKAKDGVISETVTARIACIYWRKSTV